MARRIRQLADAQAEPQSAEALADAFHWLSCAFMARDPSPEGDALAELIGAEVERIHNQSQDPLERVTRLRAYLDSLGVLDAAERRLAHLRARRANWAPLQYGEAG